MRRGGARASRMNFLKKKAPHERVQPLLFLSAGCTLGCKSILNVLSKKVKQSENAKADFAFSLRENP